MNGQKEQCLAQAVEMEKEGKAFYLKTAAEVESPLAKTIFEDLAKAEDRHMEKIKELYGRLKKEEPFKEWIMCINNGPTQTVFGDITKAAASKNDLDALRIGLQMEEKSIKYYQGLAEQSADRYEKRFYLALSQEEWGHYLTIMDSVEYLSDPEGWYFVHERDMEDGG